MLVKLMACGDLHKLPKDISTIKGYVKCNDTVQESLIELITTQDITHFIELGDWYDKGYVDDVSSALADTSVEEYIHKMLNGNFYGVIGNHIRLRMDSNPELMLIQPHPVLKSRKKVRRTEPIIKTPDHLRFGNIQISLVHHIPHCSSVEDYVVNRLPGVKYHIACVHDPLFIPNNKLIQAQYPTTNSLDSQISRVLSGVDLCIAGDCHTPLGLFDVSPTTKMIIPGSLTNTNSSLKSRHGSIKIPIIEIDDEKDTVSLSFYDFNLHLNMLTFEDRASEKIVDKIKSIRGNNITDLYEDKELEVVLKSGISSNSFSSFLREQQYTENDKQSIKNVIKDPADIKNLIRLHYDDLNIREEV